MTGDEKSHDDEIKHVRIFDRISKESTPAILIKVEEQVLVVEAMLLGYGLYHSVRGPNPIYTLDPTTEYEVVSRLSLPKDIVDGFVEFARIHMATGLGLNALTVTLCSMGGMWEQTKVS